MATKDKPRAPLSRTLLKPIHDQFVEAERIDFHLDAPLDLMVDGEVITMTPVRLDVLRHAVEVRV